MELHLSGARLSGALPLGTLELPLKAYLNALAQTQLCRWRGATFSWASMGRDDQCPQGPLGDNLPRGKVRLGESGDRGGMEKSASPSPHGNSSGANRGSPAWTLFLLRMPALPFNTSGALVPDHAGFSSRRAPLSRTKGTLGHVLTVPACRQVCWKKTGGRALAQAAKRPGNKSPALGCLVRWNTPSLDCSPVAAITNTTSLRGWKTAYICYLAIRTPKQVYEAKVKVSVGLVPSGSRAESVFFPFSPSRSLLHSLPSITTSLFCV